MSNIKFLLDSNIIIHLLRKNREVREYLQSIGLENCCISEITLMELLYGAECSNKPIENRKVIKELSCLLEIIPISVCIEEYCKQKARLRKKGTPIEDFDLIIGTTAVAMSYIMVTENTKHFSRIENIQIENWIDRKINDDVSSNKVYKD